MKIKLPELSLVLLAGATSSGKSTFARQHFLPTEVISSDICRAWVSDNENNLDATSDAFDVLRYLVAKRLKRGKLTVVDATNVRVEDRQSLIQLARDYHCLPVVIALHLPEKILKERHQKREDRNFGLHVIHAQYQALKQSVRHFKKEGFRQIYILKTIDDIAEAKVIREPLWNNKQTEKGPFDIIGDVHGCYDELYELLQKLGYQITHSKVDVSAIEKITHPAGRQVIFLGDLVDRGPKSPEVLALVMKMVAQQSALCVPGNHDMKLLKYLRGKPVQINHGLDLTLEQLSHTSEAFREEVAAFIYRLVSHYVLDDGNLVVAHAGLTEDMQGRGSAAVRDFCFYGESTGEIDEFGLPVRYNWAAAYQGKAMVVYGHTPVPEPEWLNHTIDIDTGCVFGGQLTALRYPEKELVSVKAQQTYCEPVRPLAHSPEPTRQLTAQQAYDDLLHIEDVSGKRVIQTELTHPMTIRHEQSIAALEVMARFAINPKWLIYLPPTMSPTATSALPHLLEHPQEAFDYYQKQGVAQLICEEKHMGSRAIVISCKTPQVAQTRFGLTKASLGICYTRSGRNFFAGEHAATLEQAFLQKVNQALTHSDFWSKFDTDWVCFDCELMPWSAKAQDLIQQQYAAVSAAARPALQNVTQLLQKTQQRLPEAGALLEAYQSKQHNIQQYNQAFLNYCRDVTSVEDLTLAPFHLMATEGKVHTDKTHEWHMQQIAQICKADPAFLLATPYKTVTIADVESQQAAIDWWTKLTAAGGEGMVVKPLDFVVQGNKGLIQPAIKCRGSEYLRIIYGPDYNQKPYMDRLKNRNLSAKRSMALKEFALGVEALQRFVQKQPLRKIHECVFGVLAMESEEIDPRL